MSPYRQSSLPKLPPKTSWYRLVWAHLTRLVLYKLYLRNKLRRYYRDVELTGGWYIEHFCDYPEFCEMCKRPIHPKCGVFKKDGTYYGRSIRFNPLELKQFYSDINRLEHLNWIDSAQSKDINREIMLLEHKEKYLIHIDGREYTSATGNETYTVGTGVSVTGTEAIAVSDEYKDWPSNSWERGEKYISAAILVPKENK